MNAEHAIVVDRLPAKLRGYIAIVMMPRRRFRAGDTLPHIRLTRRGLRIDRDHLARFREACGYPSSEQVPLAYPLALAFHYHLGVFAHWTFPWSLRRMLGLRNHVVQRRRISAGDVLNLTSRTLDLAIRPKGVEISVHTLLSRAGESVWEGIHVYYFRDSTDGMNPQAARFRLEPLDEVESESGWTAPNSGGLRFARLSGDFNPVHYFAPLARVLGFRGPTCHTQRIVPECLRRLPTGGGPPGSAPCRLDVAFKGPVYYGEQLTTRWALQPGGYRFDLCSNGSARPLIQGSIRVVDIDHDILADCD